MRYASASFFIFSRLAVVLLACLGASCPLEAAAVQKTVCTVTINSSDEKDVLQRRLPPDKYRFVELVQHGKRDWLEDACQRRVTCDVLVISGHYDDGSEFYTDRVNDREFLTTQELQQASCSASCGGLFAQLKEVYLFGCNTLKSQPRQLASAEVARSLLRSGHSQADAEHISALLSERYGQSNLDRLRHVFKDVPVLYGFSSKAPLGRAAGPLLERYFQSAPASEIGSGRASPTLLSLFKPNSMIAVAGLTEADPHASFRRDMCGFADDRPSDAQKLRFMHEVLQRDVTEVRMLLDHIEHYAASVGPAQRQVPEVTAALSAIASDYRTRDRFLEFARDADEAAVQTRMMALARALGWLTPAQEQEEFLKMIAARMSRGRLDKAEVDLICENHQDGEPDLSRRLLVKGPARNSDATHSAALACLGSSEAHKRIVRALTSSNVEDVATAEIYLRHRPLSDLSELRSVVSDIGRITTASAQVRALDALARQHLADPQSLQEIAQLFAVARSLEVQRAVAGILIRSDYQLLAQSDLSRNLRHNRLKSPDGNDIIDALIRQLQ